MKDVLNIQPGEVFEITEDDLKLLQHCIVEWNHCETGAPTIDPKRPYGNSSVERDVATILGKTKIQYKEDGWEEFYDNMINAHYRVLATLQIILCVGEFKTGRFVRTDKFYPPGNWKETRGITYGY